jgi:hypothetical protein
MLVDAIGFRTNLRMQKGEFPLRVLEGATITNNAKARDNLCPLKN